MAKQPTKASPRLTVPPPGTLAFADGGAGRPETADELMARMTAKYGAPSAGNRKRSLHPSLRESSEF